MSAEPLGVDVVKEVFVVFRKHPIRLYNEHLARGVHFHLSLLPIGFRDGKFNALVGLNLVDYIVLSVKVDSESYLVLTHFLNFNLSVTPLDAEVVKDAMLIRRTCGGVLIGEVVLGDSELHVPPLCKGVGFPIAHNGCRIARSHPTRSRFVLNHIFFRAFSRYVMPSMYLPRIIPTSFSLSPHFSQISA